ncbi:sensor histidine kinase [Abyssisolibacter fermentans]|uniref:sensor histidine kinase n=1 Tax=Abyssisolibacter fermentans TaxID=1766203 RepID=UPI00082B92E5|nr:sensor histidine kinase [Abyssisolibacter fermentans]
MTIVLVIIIVILLVFVYIQHLRIKNRNNNLAYIHEKLEDIISKGSSERIYITTQNTYIRNVLVSINELINYNQKTTANYKRNQIYMKKMLSNISHDLKTPLTVILGYIETLNIDNQLENDEMKEALLKVQNKTEELIILINKFFNLAKLESGDKDIPITRVNMNDICSQNILEFYDVLNNKGIDVKINMPDNNVYAFGNEEAMGRVLNNLISNAIRYGYEGKVVGLDVRADDEFVYVDVWDKGRGIDEIHQDKVFERLYTVEDSRNKSFQGSGLGLTITKRLIERMDAEIHLYSKPYDKTIFTIKLKRILY